MNALHLLNLLHTDLRSALLYAPVSHEDEARDAVEGRHAEVCHGQIDQEVVGHVPHTSVS